MAKFNQRYCLMINIVPSSMLSSILGDSLEQGIEHRHQLVRSVTSYMVSVLMKRLAIIFRFTEPAFIAKKPSGINEM